MDLPVYLFLEVLIIFYIGDELSTCFFEDYDNVSLVGIDKASQLALIYTYYTI